MVFLIGMAAAAALGFGYVLQQQVASHIETALPLSAGLLAQILRRRVWWLGLVASIVGQLLGTWALGLGTLALVEPLLSMSLLVAFGLAAVRGRHAPRWQEVLGTLLLAASLGVFLGVSGPHAATRLRWDVLSLIVAAVAVAALVGGLVAAARRRRLAVEAVLIAVAAGLLYGLQDLSTRGALLAYDAGGAGRVADTPWPYLAAAAGVCGLFLTQSAYRAGRLDYSLPPTTATEPVVGIALGIGVLGDRLSVNPITLLIDALCMVASAGGVVLIARSPVLRPPARSRI